MFLINLNITVIYLYVLLIFIFDDFVFILKSRSKKLIFLFVSELKHCPYFPDHMKQHGEKSLLITIIIDFNL